MADNPHDQAEQAPSRASGAAHPQVSVVIPTHNRLRLLRRALTTVFAQQGVGTEIIVVDDGSSDGTCEALAGLSGAVTVIRHAAPLGVSAARNAGIERAQCEWLAFLDDDDLWSPDKLSAQLAAADDTVGWVVPGATALTARLGLIGKQRVPDMPDLTAALFEFNVVPGGGSGVLARASLVRKVGGFDPNFSNLADRDLWIRLALAAPAAIVDLPLVGYVIHGGGMAHNVRRSEDENEHISRKYATEREEMHVSDERVALWLGYIGGMYLRAGQRLSAARIHSRLAIGQRLHRAWVLTGAGLVTPLVQRIRDRRAAAAIDEEWRAATEHWLAPLRAREAAGDPWCLDATAN
jgi:glycosyltransferase involved in cell wall biosynthesis